MGPASDPQKGSLVDLWYGATCIGEKIGKADMSELLNCQKS